MAPGRCHEQQGDEQCQHDAHTLQATTRGVDFFALRVQRAERKENSELRPKPPAACPDHHAFLRTTPGTRPILRFKYRPAAVVLRCVGALLAFIDERDRMRVASGNGRKRGRAAAGLDDQGGSSSRSALPAAGDGVLPEWSSDVENGLKAVGLLHKGSPSVVQLLHDVTREQVVLPGEVRELLGQEVQVTVEGATVGQQVEGLKAKLSEMTR